MLSQCSSFGRQEELLQEVYRAGLHFKLLIGFKILLPMHIQLSCNCNTGIPEINQGHIRLSLEWHTGKKLLARKLLLYSAI